MSEREKEIGGQFNTLITVSKTHRSAMHMNRRAQWYMEKRLLRDLWRAWNSAEVEIKEAA